MSSMAGRLCRGVGSLLVILALAVGHASATAPAAQAQGTLPGYFYTNNNIFQLELSGAVRCHTHYVRSDIGPESWHDGYHVRTDFQNTKQIFSTGRSLYRVATNGDLYWYGDVYSQPCTGPWTPPNGGTPLKLNPPGWQNWKKVYPGQYGVIYVQRWDDTVWWYRHAGYGSGANTWASGSGVNLVGEGWTARTIVTGGNGVFYMVDDQGRMFWHRHVGWETGQYVWYWPPRQVGGVGWNAFPKLFASDDGQLYRVDTNGRLWWCRHDGYLLGDDLWAACRIVDDQRNWLVFITDHAILGSWPPSRPIIR